MITTETSTALLVKMVLTAWHGQNTRVDDLLSKLSDEQLLHETAPGRNTGIAVRIRTVGADAIQLINHTAHVVDAIGCPGCAATGAGCPRYISGIRADGVRPGAARTGTSYLRQKFRLRAVNISR